MGPNVKSRFIVLYLENLTQGQHTFRELMSMETPVDTGLEVIQPGVHEHIINFTVDEPEIYPILSSTVRLGSIATGPKKPGSIIYFMCPMIMGLILRKNGH